MGKRLGFLFLTIALVVSFFTPWEVNANKKVAIFINDTELHLEQPPILQNGRTYVPLRGVLESLGAEVEWKSSTREVIVNRDQRNVILKIGSSVATIDGRNTFLDAPPFIHNSRTYVPFRFISEAIGAGVVWDAGKHAVLISMENVAVQPKPPVTRTQLLGQSSQLLYAELGQPKQRSISEYGFEWSSFHNEYQNFALIGLQNGKAVALYTNSNTYLKTYGLSTTNTKSNVREKFGKPLTSIQKGNTIYEYKDKNGGWDLFDVDGGYLTVFYDIHKGNTVTSIFHVTKEIEQNKTGYYGKINDQVRDSFEKILFELTNAIRVREGIHSLQWDARAAASARLHSEDMAKNNYFSHTSLTGLSPFDRMTRDGVTYSTAGENLAMGQFNSIFAHEGLMNSMGHRKNILSHDFSKLGTGVSFASDKRPYYTQKYFKP